MLLLYSKHVYILTELVTKFGWRRGESWKSRHLQVFVNNCWQKTVTAIEHLLHHQESSQSFVLSKNGCHWKQIITAYALHFHWVGLTHWFLISNAQSTMKMVTSSHLVQIWVTVNPFLPSLATAVLFLLAWVTVNPFLPGRATAVLFLLAWGCSEATAENWLLESKRL